MASTPSRPLSPHLQIWKWGPHMLVSTLHRLSGLVASALFIVGVAWWMLAAAAGPDAYADFTEVASGWVGIAAGVLLTWTLLQHTASGLRHLVLDAGAGYELQTNKFWSRVTLALPLLATLLVWAFILGVFA